LAAKEPIRNPRNRNVKLIADKQDNTHTTPDKTNAKDVHTTADKPFSPSKPAAASPSYPSNPQKATDRSAESHISTGQEYLERICLVQNR
jgi:hypothetical protein